MSDEKKTAFYHAKWEKVEELLHQAREYICYTDEELDKKAKRVSQRTKKARDTPWSFIEYMENREYELAWDELVWAAERVDAMIRIGGGNMRCDKCKKLLEWPDRKDIGASRAIFWRVMAMAAREMMDEGAVD